MLTAEEHQHVIRVLLVVQAAAPALYIAGLPAVQDRAQEAIRRVLRDWEGPKRVMRSLTATEQELRGLYRVETTTALLLVMMLVFALGGPIGYVFIERVQESLSAFIAVQLVSYAFSLGLVSLFYLLVRPAVSRALAKFE